MGSLGEAVLELKADGNKLYGDLITAKGKVKKAVGEMKTDLSSLGSSLSNIGSSITNATSRVSATLTNIGSSITRNVTVPVVALGAGMVALGVNAVQTGADFDRAMSGVQAILGGTSEDLAKLKSLAMNLGLDPTLIVSASQAAGVMEELAKNGLTTDQILNGAARSAIALANATGTDFSTSAAVASTAMQLFNLNAEQMENVVNNVTGVANASRFSVEDFAQAIAMGGGVAAAMGIPIEDFATAVAGLSNSFSSGSDAGTSFKVFLQRLAPDTKPAIEAMKDLGIITKEGQNRFFDSEGGMKSLSEIAGVLQEAFKGLSDEQKILAFTNIFGTDAMRAANAMAELGAEGFDKLSASMAKTNAPANAATRMDNLAGAVEILTGIVEYFKLKFTDAFGPSIRMVVERFSKFLSDHAPEIERIFTLLSFTFKEVAEKMADGIEKNGPAVLAFFDKMATSMPTVVDKLSEIGTQALPYVQKFFDAFTNVTPDQIAKIIEGILGLAAAGPALMTLGGALPSLIAFGAFMASGISVNKDDLIEFFTKMKEALPDFIAKIKEVGTIVGPHLQKLVDAFMNMKPETAATILEIAGALAILGPVLVGLGGFISTVVAIGTAISSVIGLFGGFGSILATIGTAAAAVGAFLTGGIVLPLLLIAATVVIVYNAWVNNLGGIRTTAEQLWFILKYGFSQMIEKIKGAFDINWGDLGKKIIDGLVNGINNGVDAVKGAVEGIANAAIETWKNITDTNSPSMVFDELGQFAGAGYIQGFSKSMSPQRLAPVMQNVMGGVAQTVSHVNHTSVTINNPAPEPASRSVDKTLKNLNYLRRAK